MKNIVISDNLIKNGEFNSTSWWERSAGIEIDRGIAWLGNNTYIKQQTSIITGNLFRIKFTVYENNSTEILGKMIIDEDLLSIELPITRAGNYEFDGLIPADRVGPIIYIKFASEKGFGIDNVEVFRLAAGEQLLKNGNFADDLEYWKVDGAVTVDDRRAVLPVSSSIEQSVKVDTSKALALTFTVTYCENGGGSVGINGLKPLNFSKNGIYTYDYSIDSADDNRTVRFDATGSFRLDNIRLVAN